MHHKLLKGQCSSVQTAEPSLAMLEKRVHNSKSRPLHLLEELHSHRTRVPKAGGASPRGSPHRQGQVCKVSAACLSSRKLAGWRKGHRRRARSFSPPGAWCWGLSQSDEGMRMVKDISEPTAAAGNQCHPKIMNRGA